MGIYNVQLVSSNLAEYLGLMLFTVNDSRRSLRNKSMEKICDPAGIQTQDLQNTPSWIPYFFPWIYFSLSQQKKKSLV